VVHPGGVATSIARNARVPAGVSDAQAQQGLANFEKMLRLSPERAAEIIVRAVEADRHRVLVGVDAVISSWLERLMPVSYWRLIGKVVPPPA
jgi:hypothetical protein